MLEYGARRRPSERGDDAVAERGALFCGHHRNAPLGKRKAVLLQPVQRVQHAAHVLDDHLDDECMILPFDSGRGEAEDPEVGRQTAPPGNLLRAEAAVRGRQTRSAGGRRRARASRTSSSRDHRRDGDSPFVNAS